MEFLWNLVILVAGFIFLIKGADVFVGGCSSVAKKFRIPSIIVGLTIVSMGTSLPEMAVSISAAIQGNNAIAVSNIVGSNFFNLMIVLGVCAAIKPIAVQKSIMRREFPLNLIITLTLGVFSAEMLFNGTISDKIKSAAGKIGEVSVGKLGHLDGALLLVIFVIFIVTSVVMAVKARNNSEDDDEIIAPLSMTKSIIFIVVGIVAIAIGGQIVVDSATYIASALGMTDTLIGLTIVALGTSLPELVTSIVAARKGENDIAVGNVVGSNLFNILFVLGASSAITPIEVSLNSLIDMGLLLIASLLVYFFAIQKKKLSRFEGIFMVLVYCSYMVYIIMRN